MNFYKILSFVLNLNPRLRLLAVWLRHITGGRYLGLHIDPILACNYKCLMCYRSNEDNRQKGAKRMSMAQIENVAKALMHRAMKVQIGCATDPSLAVAESVRLIELAKEQKVPFISMCTNGVLLSEEDLRQMAAAGLKEIIISCHGITKESYEYFMGGKYEQFLALMARIQRVKKDYPTLKLRLNYTMNADNTEELRDFFKQFEGMLPDILQLRPIQDINGTAYTNYDLTPIAARMDTIIRPLIEEGTKRGMQVLAPTKENLLQLGDKKSKWQHINERFSYFTYAYISADICMEDDFHPEKEDYETFARRNHLGRKIWHSIFMTRQKEQALLSTSTKPLNYSIS